MFQRKILVDHFHNSLFICSMWRIPKRSMSSTWVSSREYRMWRPSRRYLTKWFCFRMLNWCETAECVILSWFEISWTHFSPGKSVEIIRSRVGSPNVLKRPESVSVDFGFMLGKVCIDFLLY